MMVLAPRALAAWIEGNLLVLLLLLLFLLVRKIIHTDTSLDSD